MFSHELTPMLGIFKGAFIIEGISRQTRGSSIQNASQKYPRSIKHYFLFLNQNFEGYLRDTYQEVSGQYPSIGAVSGWIRALSEVSVQHRLPVPAQTLIQEP